MPEREPREAKPEQGEQGMLSFAELSGRMKVEFARQRILDLRQQEKEFADHLQEAYQKCHEEVCSFLGIDSETRLAKEWAGEILDYAEERNLRPRMFASRLVATIENAQRIIDNNGGSLPEPRTAKKSYLNAVKAMRGQTRPSMPEGEVYSGLMTAIAISREDENECQHAVYLWITKKLGHSESFWWVIVGKPKQAS